MVNLPQTVVIITITILLSLYFIFKLPYMPLLWWAGFALLWLKISGHLLASNIFSGRTNKFILGVFLFVPIMLSLMFTIGLDQALKDSKIHNPNAFLSLTHQIPKVIPTIILRHLEKGLLAKDLTNNNYVVYMWDNISKVEIISENINI